MASTKAQKKAAANYRKKNKAKIAAYHRALYLKKRKNPNRPWIPTKCYRHDLERLWPFIKEDWLDLMGTEATHEEAVATVAKKYHCSTRLMNEFLNDFRQWID